MARDARPVIDTQTPDFELLHAWRAGDRRAGGVLIDRYHALLYRFFRNKAADVVEDLVQRTFLICVERRDEIRDAASFRAYLLAIARSELVRHFRHHGRRKRVFDPLSASAADLSPTPSRILAARQEQRILLEGLRRIPLPFQVALELYYWERATAPELAQVLDVPIGTVRSRLRRAKQLLRQEIERVEASVAVRTETLSNLDAWAASLRRLTAADPSVSARR